MTGLTVGGFLSLTVLRTEGCGIAAFGSDEFYMLPDGSENRTTSLRSWKCTPIPLRGLLLKGSMTLDFRVVSLPYKSSSFATLEGEVF